MTDEPQEDHGTAGASALRRAPRIHEHRRSVETNRKRVARFAAALFGPEVDKRLRQAERNRTAGGEAEQSLAGYLAHRCPAVPMLHDRRAPRSRGNIDHVAIAPSGIYVIDCKRHRGKIEITQPLFGRAKLKINGRDQSKLIDGLDKQVARVLEASADIAAEIPVHGCLCVLAPEGLLADSGLPLLRTLRLNGYPLYHPRRLAKRLNRPGPLGAELTRELHAGLAERLPRA
jgi:hypothetical protein